MNTTTQIAQRANDLASLGGIRQLLEQAGVRSDLVNAASNAVLSQLEQTTGANAQGTSGMLPGAGRATGSAVARVVNRAGDAHASADDIVLTATGEITRNLEVNRA